MQTIGIKKRFSSARKRNLIHTKKSSKSRCISLLYRKKYSRIKYRHTYIGPKNTRTKTTKKIAEVSRTRNKQNKSRAHIFLKEFPLPGTLRVTFQHYPTGPHTPRFAPRSVAPRRSRGRRHDDEKWRKWRQSSLHFLYIFVFWGLGGMGWEWGEGGGGKREGSFDLPGKRESHGDAFVCLRKFLRVVRRPTPRGSKTTRKTRVSPRLSNTYSRWRNRREGKKKGEFLTDETLWISEQRVTSRWLRRPAGSDPKNESLLGKSIPGGGTSQNTL